MVALQGFRDYRQSYLNDEQLKVFSSVEDLGETAAESTHTQHVGDAILPIACPALLANVVERLKANPN